MCSTTDSGCWSTREFWTGCATRTTPAVRKPAHHQGHDLYSVLLSLTAWGDKYKNDVPPMKLIHRRRGHPAEARMTCAHCGQPVSWREMTAEYQPDA